MNDVFYICDRKKCEPCYSACRHTTDITHALNFEKDDDMLGYVEKDKEDQNMSKADVNYYETKEGTVKKFEEELKDWLMNRENMEQQFYTSTIHILNRNDICTFDQLRHAIEHPKKTIWYFDLRGIGPSKAICLERFVSYKLGKPIPHKDPTIEELKAQINELNREINQLRKGRSTNA